MAGDDAYAAEPVVPPLPLCPADHLGPRALQRVQIPLDRPQHLPWNPVRPALAPALHALGREPRRPHPLATRAGELDIEDARPLTQPEPGPVQAVDEGRVPVLVEPAGLPPRASQTVEAVSAQPNVAPLFQGVPKEPLHLAARRTGRAQWITPPSSVRLMRCCLVVGAHGRDRIRDAEPGARPGVEAVESGPVGVEGRRPHPLRVPAVGDTPVLERLDVPDRGLVPGGANGVQEVQPHHERVRVAPPGPGLGRRHAALSEEEVDPGVGTARRRQDDGGAVTGSVMGGTGVQVSESGRLQGLRVGRRGGEVVEVDGPAFQGVHVRSSEMNE